MEKVRLRSGPVFQISAPRKRRKLNKFKIAKILTFSGDKIPHGPAWRSAKRFLILLAPEDGIFPHPTWHIRPPEKKNTPPS